MSHLRSANDKQSLSEALPDIVNTEASQKADGLLEELTSEEEFPGIADMIKEIVSAGGE